MFLAEGAAIRKHRDRRRPRDLMRVNKRIRVSPIRVIDEKGNQLGVLETRDALQAAQEKGLDLVEISPKAKPYPVCRIMDYGKFKYDQSKKKRQAKKSASVVEVKEIKFRPKTEKHDLDTKIRKIRGFLEEGNKCRLVIVFRGREITHPKTGLAVLDKVVENVEDLGHVESKPNIEGKRMFMILAPTKGASKSSGSKKSTAKSEKPETSETSENSDAKPAAAKATSSDEQAAPAADS